jgi:hypothetical protein
MKLEFSRQILEAYPCIKFHENPCNVNRVVPRGKTDGETGVMKLTVAFRNFPNAPKTICGNLREA